MVHELGNSNKGTQKYSALVILCILVPQSKYYKSLFFFCHESKYVSPVLETWFTKSWPQALSLLLLCHVQQRVLIVIYALTISFTLLSSGRRKIKVGDMFISFNDRNQKLYTSLLPSVMGQNLSRPKSICSLNRELQIQSSAAGPGAYPKLPLLDTFRIYIGSSMSVYAIIIVIF